MAALFGESVGHLDSANLSRKYETAISTLVVSAGSGYLGGNALTGGQAAYFESQPWLIKRVTPATASEGIMGYRSKVTALPYSGGAFYAELSCWSGLTRQFSLNTTSTGQLQVLRGSQTGTVLGTTTNPVFVNNTFVFIEVRWKISGTVGELEIRADNMTVLNLSGVNLQGAGGTAWNGFEWVPGLTEYICDMYLIDLSGSTCNYFLGKGFHGYCNFPIADAGVAWTPASGANYAAVDDATPDLGATFVRAQTNGVIDRYQIGAFDPASVVHFVQGNHLIRKASSSVSNRFAPIAQVNGADYISADRLVESTGYLDQREIWALNPETGLPWTIDEINASRFGLKRVA